MSERVGSEIERLWISMTRYSVDFESMEKRVINNNFLLIRNELLLRNELLMITYYLKPRVVLCRIRLFPTFISEIKGLGSELPLKFNTVIWFWLNHTVFFFLSVESKAFENVTFRFFNRISNSARRTEWPDY